MGIWEILIVVAILFLLFGATKLPALGHSLGRLVRSYKQGRVNNDQIEITRPGQRSMEKDSKN